LIEADHDFSKNKTKKTASPVDHVQNVNFFQWSTDTNFIWKYWYFLGI